MTAVYDHAASHVPLPGTVNVRDLGGLPVRAGVLAAGRLLRAEAITQADTGGRVQHWSPKWESAYRPLGLRQVIDLRNADESELAPSAWGEATGATLTPVPLHSGGMALEERLIEGMLSGKVEPLVPQDMGRFMTSLIDRRPVEIGAVVRAIGEGGAPVLVHCTAGKDRTGAVIGVILSALGADDEAIVADYAMTEVLRPHGYDRFEARFAAAGISFDGVRVLGSSPAEAMRFGLAHLESEYGGGESYLRGPGKVTEDELDRLRDTLVTTG